MGDNYTFGIQDLKIAPWLGGGLYDTAVDVPGIKQLQVQENTTNAQQEGDDAIVAVASKLVSATITMQYGRFSYAVMEVYTGQTSQQCSDGSKKIYRTNRKTPYFGLSARIDEAEGDGDQHIFIPKLKVMEGIQFAFEYGAFATPQLTAMAVIDENFVDEDDFPSIYYLPGFPTRTVVSIPPVI